jgi:hypothetical protein
MTSGAHLSPRREEGQRRLEAVALSCDGGGNPAGHRRSPQTYWVGREGGSLGRSGPARRPELAGLISIGKIQNGFDF